MVSIKRPGSARPPFWKSLLTIRNFIIAVVIVQGFRNYILPFAETKKQAATAAGESPKTVHDAWQEEHERQMKALRGKKKTKPQAVAHHPNELEDIPQKQRFHEQQDQEANSGSAPVDAGAGASDEHHGNSAKVETKASEKAPKASGEVKSKQQQQQQVELDANTALVLAKHGTGPTRLGYVVDLVHERENPPFRLVKSPLLEGDGDSELEKKVAGLVGAQAVQKCEYLQTVGGSDVVPSQRTSCQDSDTVLYVYNRQSFRRTLCGHALEPGQAMKLPDDCSAVDDLPHLFPSPASDLPHVPVDSKGMPPILVQSQPGVLPDDKFDTIDTCDIGCKWERDMPMGEQDYKYIYGTKWKILMTDADPYFRERAKVERTAYRQDLYYSTTSFKSSVPISFFDFAKYDLRNRPALDWETAANKATYTLDDQCNVNGGFARRQKWFGAVAAKMPTAAYGTCHHNTDLQEGETVKTLEGRVALSKKNRIHLAFEMGLEKDYVTSITWEALLSGAVPAIMGAANLEDILPKHSAIYANDYNQWDKFADAVVAIANNKEEWESYHAWRKDPAALDDFERRFNFTRTSVECRMCRWAYAKQYGLGWCHQQQIVKAPYIDRTLCLANGDNQVVTRPFRESWSVVGGTSAAGEAEETCGSVQTSEASIEGDGFKIDRRILQHDGVTDMILKSVTGGKLVLKLEIPQVKNLEGAYFPHTHTLVQDMMHTRFVSSASIQDTKSKVTVLANWQTRITSPQAGVILVELDTAAAADQLRRIRVITEDFNTLHDKPTEFFPTTFGQLMTRDFVDPLEYFHATSAASVA